MVMNVRRWIAAILGRTPMGVTEALVLVVTDGVVLLSVALGPFTPKPDAPVSLWGLWWLVIGASVILLVRGVMGLVGWIVSAVVRHQPPVPDRVALADLATAAWQEIVENRDLTPTALNADARSKALRQWGHQWEINVERALAGDEVTLADFKHDVNTRQMDYRVTPAFNLETKLRLLGDYVPPLIRSEMQLQERWDTAGEQPQETPKTTWTAAEVAEYARTGRVRGGPRRVTLIDPEMAGALAKNGPQDDADQMALVAEPATPEPFVDFLEGPNATLTVKTDAVMATLNAGRRQRAQIRAWVALRKELGREPSAAELAHVAQTLHERNDTALGVTEEEAHAYLAAGGTMSPELLPWNAPEQAATGALQRATDRLSWTGPRKASNATHVRGTNLPAPDSDGEQAVCTTCSWKGPFRQKLAEHRLIDADFGAHLKDPETAGSPIGKYPDAPGTPLRGSAYLMWADGGPTPPGNLPAAPTNLTVRLVPELGSPVMDEIAYTTVNRPHRPVDCGGQPRLIRFSEPRDQLVTPADLGELAIPCGQGRLVVERFYDRGVVIDEHGTSGDNVRFTAYFDD